MRKHRVVVTTFATLFALGVVGVAQAWAQNGVISFWDGCNNRAYVMRGEAESASNPRVLVPLPSPPNGSWGRLPLDISTSGPVTVLLFGLFAVQVNDIGGNLVPDAPVNIRLDADLFHLPATINDTASARFSPTGDRVALVSDDGVLVVADIVRDENQKITGLNNPTVVAKLFEIGSPSDSNSGYSFAGYPDFSPDGTKIVVSIYGDLWLLTLGNDGHSLASSPPPQPLTRTVGDTDLQAALSPDGSTLAYIGTKNRHGSSNVFTLNLGTLAVTQLTSASGKDMLVGPQYPAWSPDGQSLAFSAQGQRAPRGSPCYGVVNDDIYEIQADGSGNLILLTNTIGTGNEFHWCQWGW